MLRHETPPPAWQRAAALGAHLGQRVVAGERRPTSVRPLLDTVGDLIATATTDDEAWEVLRHFTFAVEHGEARRLPLRSALPPAAPAA